VNSRILWAFSAAIACGRNRFIAEMARRAFEFVMNQFWDSEHGGASGGWMMRAGCIDDSKKIYGQAFYIYALTEFHRTFGNHQALARAQELV
jgi:mannobiose 2-epimerase